MVEGDGEMGTHPRAPPRRGMWGDGEMGTHPRVLPGVECGEMGRWGDGE
ncbi:MAG: hypothetical protein F6K01_33430 [Okeania sp. SIO1I7]|nr:hypothetical protein [Okeania sp. SIO1I7]